MPFFRGGYGSSERRRAARLERRAVAVCVVFVVALRRCDRLDLRLGLRLRLCRLLVLLEDERPQRRRVIGQRPDHGVQPLDHLIA